MKKWVIVGATGAAIVILGVVVWVFVGNGFLALVILCAGFMGISGVCHALISHSV
jgi:hypothetical protein